MQSPSFLYYPLFTTPIKLELFPTEHANHHWPLNTAWRHIGYRRAAHQKPGNFQISRICREPYYP